MCIYNCKKLVISIFCIPNTTPTFNQIRGSAGSIKRKHRGQAHYYCFSKNVDLYSILHLPLHLVFPYQVLKYQTKYWDETNLAMVCLNYFPPPYFLNCIWPVAVSKTEKKLKRTWTCSSVLHACFFQWRILTLKNKILSLKSCLIIYSEF